jgi:SprB repeat
MEEDGMKRLIPLLFVALASAGAGAATALAAPAAAPAGTVAPSEAVTVFIGGLRRINRQATCTWEANVSGGTAPYTYSWSTVNGGGYGVEATWYGGFPSSGTLTVTVTDALNATATTTINVAAITNGPLCP